MAQHSSDEPGAMAPLALGDADAARLRDSDAERLRHVHPSDWTNPQASGTFNLVVIGGGTAGLVAAAATAGLGGRVALIEGHQLGGDCLNTGCVPSKALLHSARIARTVQVALREQSPSHLAPPVDFAAVMARVRALRAHIAPMDGAPRFRDLGVEVFFGKARFDSPRSIAVAGQRLHFSRALIATGARPSVPPIEGLADAGYLTSETVFELRELPKRVAIIGGGPIGCELAQAFARLGAEVTLFERDQRVLAHEEPAASALIESCLERDGVALELGVDIQRVTEAREMVYTDRSGQARTAGFDTLLVATGRTPRTAELDLETAQIDYTERGVVVDDRLRTTNKRVYASGDVAGSHQFTHAADEMSRLVIKNALFFGRASVKGLVIPRVTYCDPEVASVGLTEAQATLRGLAFEVVERSFAEVDRAVLDDVGHGFVKIIVERRRDRILGATIVGAHAGEIIGEVTLAMANGLGLGAIAKTVHAYPTMALGLRQVADAHQRKRLTPRVAALLRWILARRR